ncbi:MAG: peptidoglycan DD-metalloendopeptidase family protein [Bacteroidetes bacterium]|nr:peptidoglycan DD-metalloendopeptidase family protein [Bacteroidota bacterium]
MKSAINLVVLLFFFGVAYGQTSSDKLKKEQQKLEKKISNTKALLNKVKSNSQASLNELKLIDNQIKSREALVRVFDDQVRVAEIKMVEKKQEVNQLKTRLIQLKKQYKSMLLYAYKHRNNYGKIMFILSSDNYNEASKRTKYLKKVAGIQKKQMALILQHRSLIDKELNQIKEEKETKSKALEEKKIEREQISMDKLTKEKTYQKFKQEEQKLYAQLKEDERKKEELKQKINAAIRADIARQEAERAKKEAEAAKKREADAKKKKEQEELARKNKEKEKGKTPATTTPEKTTEKEPEEPKTPVFIETSEGSVAGKNFESNKGRLPAPVSSGSIVESFGRNAHPTLRDVFTNNNGVDYACSKGANVRAIFEGEVTSVFSITGSGKVVIIKHGSYRSVYSNLKETYVSIGSKVSTKQAIGSLMIDDNVSICHFEIHQVVGGIPKCLNPQLWVGR